MGFLTRRVAVPVWALLLGGLVLMGVGSATAPADDAEEVATTGTTTTTSPPLTTASTAPPTTTGRTDAQSEDQQVAIGQSVRLSGYTATVNSAGFQQSVNEFQDDGYLVAEVTIVNRDDRAQPYNLFDWKLQTPQGQVLTPGIVAGEQLGSGDLVQGGTVSGKVVWEIGATKGEFFIIYKPDPFDAARGIWPVTV